MSRGTRRTAQVVTALAVAVWLAGAGLASASMKNLKTAKDLGFPATSCTYCHVDKLPKKGASALNDRGNWLKAEKDKRTAKEVDVSWLKEYVEKK